VFSTDAGKRVLAQIMAEAKGLPVTLNQIESHPYLSYRAGKNEVGDWIVKAMWAVPVAPEIEREDDDG
jgi:hypothetical protein